MLKLQVLPSLFSSLRDRLSSREVDYIFPATELFSLHGKGQRNVHTIFIGQGRLATMKHCLQNDLYSHDTSITKARHPGDLGVGRSELDEMGVEVA